MLEIRTTWTTWTAEGNRRFIVVDAEGNSLTLFPFTREASAKKWIREYRDNH